MMDFEERVNTAFDFYLKSKNTNDGIYEIAECMNDPAFITTIEQCKTGNRPDDDRLFSIVGCVCFNVLFFFHVFYENKERPVEAKIVQTAKEAALAIKKCVGKLNWSPRILESCGIEAEGEP